MDRTHSREKLWNLVKPSIAAGRLVIAVYRKVVCMGMIEWLEARSLLLIVNYSISVTHESTNGKTKKDPKWSGWH